MNYSPDDQTSTVIATFSVNALTGGVFYLLFEYFRYQKDIYASKARERRHRTPPLPPRGLFKWLTYTVSVTDEDTMRMVGMDGYLFLRFLRLCAHFCIVAGLAGALVLWPVYFTSNGHMPGIAGVNLYTMGNIEQGGDRLWASVIFCWLFNLYFLGLLNNEYKVFVRLRQTYMYEGDEDVPVQKNYTVQVEKIPFYFRSPSRLKSHFEDLFPGEVYSAYVGRNVTKLEKLVADRKELQAQLETAIAFYKGKDMQERKTVALLRGYPVLCCGGEKVDAIDYYTSEIHKLNGEIRALKYTIVDSNNILLSPSGSFASLSEIHTSKNTDPSLASFGIGTTDMDSSNDGPAHISSKKFGACSGTGFITFKSRRAHSAAYQMHVLSDVHSDITVTQAGSPEDIIWENLNSSPEEQERGEAVTNAIFSMGMLFWGSVLAFIAAVSNLSNLEKYLPFIKNLNPVLYSLLAGLLPVIVMNIFLSMLPAIFAYGLKNIAKRKKASDVQFEVFQWYFGYQLANVYLTLLTGSMFNALTDAIANPASIVRLLAAALPSVSVFFSNYIITEILTSTTGELLQLVPMIVYNVYKQVLGERTLTHRTLLLGPLAPVEVDYGEMLPNILFVVCIVLTYMVIAPFITVLGAFYFVCFYVVMKHQFLYVYVPTFETGGRFWYGLYGFSMKGLLVGSITMVGYIAVKEGVKQAPFILPIPVVIMYIWRRTEAQYERVSKDLAYSRAVQADIDGASHVAAFTPTLYTQPALLATGNLAPAPFRIGGLPLFDGKGELNDVYYELPEDEDEAGGMDCNDSKSSLFSSKNFEDNTSSIISDP